MDDPFSGMGANRVDQTFSSASHTVQSFKRNFQMFMDQITPYVAARWIFSVVILFIFMLRVIFAEGWYVICYALGIYYLTLFIDFLSPKIDPDFKATKDDLDPDSGPTLPTKVNDEFRPFIRRLPEYKFWFMGTRATLFSLFLSMFHIFNIPASWPILLCYFFILTFLTLKRQIQHMYKHRYVPWSAGKQRYGGQ